MRNVRYIIGFCLILCGALLSSSAFALSPPSPEVLKKETLLGAYDLARQVKAQSGQLNVKRGRLSQIDKVVIDPGHGQSNLGAYGKFADIYEKRLTLELAYELRDRLQKQYPDLDVYMTRYWDRNPPIESRVHLANHLDADLLISLHYNAAPHERASGIETYFIAEEQMKPGRIKRKSQRVASLKTGGENVQFKQDLEPERGISGSAMTLLKNDLRRGYLHRSSGRLAELLQKNLLDSVDKVENRGVKQQDFAILRGARMPTVVVEGGFLTHPEEGLRVLESTHRKKLLNGIVGGLRDFDQFLADTLE